MLSSVAVFYCDIFDTLSLTCCFTISLILINDTDQ